MPTEATEKMAKSMRLRVLQIVDGFRMGGAESKLWELIQRLDHRKYEIMLANVGPTGPLQAKFEELGIEMFDFRRRWALTRCLFQIVSSDAPTPS
jgi:hypothetical protein